MKPHLMLSLPLLLLPVHIESAELRPYREITGSVVRLSDLFDGMGTTRDRDLGAAPAPGTQITVQAPQLAAIARDFGVDWRPSTGAERTVLERGGIRLSYAGIIEATRRALVAAGAPADADVSLPNFENPVLPAGSNPTAEVGQVAYDPTAANFAATLAISGDGTEPLHIHIIGKIYPMADVVVLTHPMHTGAVLTGADVRAARLHSVLLRGNVPLPPAEAAGMQMRRDVTPGQPITRADVIKPTLVSRSATVRILLLAQGISLGAEGIALEEGGMGDHIRVQNPASRAVLMAEITGPNEVRVAPGRGPLQVAQQ